ncbi:cytosolic phospholipase A2 gamma-like [Trichomycterus rosablanca]|uniref:cytosolic phospholipase A2 gamma-like n=1 Tax=Trichomycterus rosablanca TaxID=2290929 RepID=UPI002F36124E
MKTKCCDTGHVIIGHVLSQGEKEHVVTRLETVLYCLKQNGIPCSVDEMPNIAVLGSGGGLRAMVALLGSVGALDKVDLLDSVMYLSGVSGSTWCMSSLYKEHDWSTNLKDLTDGIAKRLVDGKVSFWRKYDKLMKYFGESDNFSLTHVWAVMFISGEVKEIGDGGVTWQEGYNTKDPYPIYTVIDQTCEHEQQYKDVWFEITPHLSGYSHTGAFVDTKHLGSKFKAGSLTEPQSEMDRLYLQGLCGSALADFRKDIEWIINWIINWILQHIFGISSVVCHSGDFGEAEVFKTSWILSERTISKEDIIKHTLQLCEELLKRMSGIGWVILLVKIMELIKSWTWGTTNNFLYGMTDPCCSNLKTETRWYEDAGLLLNSPYFSVLREERKVDLIISLDFSDGDPFKLPAAPAASFGAFPNCFLFPFS